MKTMEEILAFVREFEKTTLTSIELETEDLKIKLTKEGTALSRSQPAEAVQPAAQPARPAPREPLVVKSPLVGTFYAAPSPKDPPFVNPGDSVRKGDVLCIVEAMKTLNEIRSPINGKVFAVHVKDRDIVGFEQALVSIEHDA